MCEFGVSRLSIVVIDSSGDTRYHPCVFQLPKICLINLACIGECCAVNPR